jgi:hypothetical protein
MNKPKKTFSQGDETHSLLKNLHKKVYSICRLFTQDYKDHQDLFGRIVAAAAHSMRSGKSPEEKHMLFLRACINMSVLHSLAHAPAAGSAGQPIQFKSPDFQKSMLGLAETIGGIPDYEKILLFLDLEKWPADKTEELSGLSPARPKRARDTPRYTPSPLKEKLIWI